MKRKKEITGIVHHKRISIQLFCSYIIILAAPTLAIIVIYFMAQAALLDVQKEKANRFLSEAVTSFDRQMEEIKNVGIYISEDTELCRMADTAYNKDKSKEFYEMYLLSRRFPDYSTTNQAIKAVYLLFPGKNYLIKMPTVAPVTKSGYNTVNGFGDMDYEKVVDTFCTKYMSGTIVDIPLENKNALFMAQSVPNSTFQDDKGAVAIALNDRTIEHLMQGARVDDMDDAFILDEEGNVISCFMGGEEKGGSTYHTFSEYLTAREMKQSEMVTTSVKSSYTGWTFATITPKKVMMQKIGYMKYVIIIFSITSILIGYAICFVYWFKRKDAVKKYCDCSDTIVGADGKKPRNFWEGLYPFLESVESLQSRVVYQEPILRAAVIQKLLYGRYDSLDDLRADLECSKLELDAERYFVAVLEFEDPLKDNIFSSVEEFQEYVQEHFRENLDLPHMLYEVNQLVYAMIIPELDYYAEDELKQKIESLNYKFYYDKRLYIFAGVSGEVTDLIKLGEMYNEALDICKYARFYGIRMPLCKGDLPSKMEVSMFPIDMEIHLENAIKKGTEEELEKIMAEINDCYLKKTMSLSMTEHLLEMVRCTAIRSLEKVQKEEAVADIMEAIQKAENQEKLFQAIGEAKQYYLQYTKVTEEGNAVQMKEYLADRINSEYSNSNFALVQLADELHISENRLYKDFKSYFGITFSEFLEQVRIRNACRLLREGCPVKEVAQQTGYGSDYSFRRAFKRVMGTTPSNLKKTE